MSFGVHSQIISYPIKNANYDGNELNLEEFKTNNVETSKSNHKIEQLQPDYDSIFFKVHQAQQKSNNPVQFSFKTFLIMFHSIFIICFYATSIILPLISIVIGSMFFNDCPLEPNVTLWLIIFGVFGFISAFISIIIGFYETLK